MSDRFCHRSLAPMIVVPMLALVFALPGPVQAQAHRGIATLPSLQAFASSLMNGDAAALRGIYADDLFALPVVQQPPSSPDFVSGLDNTVTQFGQAAAFGNVGLLAHNYLSGRYFFDLHPGQIVRLIYGQGGIESYRVMALHEYRALAPRSTSTDFVDLESGLTVSAEDLFAKLYTGQEHVVLQTCITRNGNSSWGRLFVTAIPEDFGTRQYLTK